MDDFIAISALQHYAYCSRQFALIHIEEVWAENRFTAEGRLLHERVDSGVAELRRNMRYERGVMLESQQHRIRGKMDLLEIQAGDPQLYYPVEYKRGKPKVEDWDRIQLCAQVICLEEMRGCQIDEGALWYWEIRRREAVVVTPELRSATLEVIQGAHATLAAGTTPHPTADSRRCRACSLADLCEPETFRMDRSSRYVEEMFNS